MEPPVTPKTFSDSTKSSPAQTKIFSLTPSEVFGGLT
jgi:hypothetical protein